MEHQHCHYRVAAQSPERAAVIVRGTGNARQEDIRRLPDQSLSGMSQGHLSNLQVLRLLLARLIVEGIVSE